MNRKWILLSVITAFVLLGFAFEAQRPVTVATTSTVSSHEAGMILNVDPATGQIVDHPVPGSVSLVLDQDLANDVSTSSEGLQAVHTGHGTMVDLQGRFNNMSVATIDANGKLVAPCVSSTNPAADPASQK